MRISPVGRPSLVRRLRRCLLTVIACLLLGAVAATGVAWGLAASVDPRLGVVMWAEAFDGEATVSAASATRAGAVCAVVTREAAVGSWSPRQATGKPDTVGSGDLSTAWAPQPSGGTIEWLELTYAEPVAAKALHVYETDHPGAVFKVIAYRGDGAEVVVWQGKDPTPPTEAMGVSDIPLSADFPVGRVRIYLDSKTVPGWNEIDAVGLESTAGEVQWATRAKASSSYGTGNRRPQGRGRRGSAPGVVGPARTGAAFASGSVTYETRTAAAFGWPVPALWGEEEIKPAAGSTAAGTPAGIGGGRSAFGTGSGTPPWGSHSVSPFTGGIPPPLYGGGTSGLGTPGSTPGGTAPAVALPVPRRVLWKGLAVDSVVFGVMLALLRWLLVIPRRFVREVSRVRHGRCVACGYDLGYDFIRGCPECGCAATAQPHPPRGRTEPAPPAFRRGTRSAPHTNPHSP